MENHVIKLAGNGDINGIIECSKQLFNSAVGTTFFREDNLKIAFFTLENGVAVYESFCQQFFSKRLAEDYTRDGYMASFKAQSFVNGDIYGILILQRATSRTDEWYQIILHEMGHIFCMVHEFEGDSFLERYGEKNDSNACEYGVIGIGYEIWREFIADYIADQVNPFIQPFSMATLREMVHKLDKEVDIANPIVRMVVSQIFSYIFGNTKIQQAEDVSAAFELLEKNTVFPSKAHSHCYYDLFALIFNQISKENYWKITPDFTYDLGAATQIMLARHREFR